MERRCARVWRAGCLSRGLRASVPEALRILRTSRDGRGEPLALEASLHFHPRGHRTAERVRPELLHDFAQARPICALPYGQVRTCSCLLAGDLACFDLVIASWLGVKGLNVEHHQRRA